MSRIVARLRSVRDRDGLDLTDSEFTELCRLVSQGDVFKLSSFVRTLHTTHRREMGKSLLCPTIRAEDPIRPSPFILAARHGKEDVVQYFLKRVSRLGGVNYAGTMATSEELTVNPDSVPGCPSFATLRHPVVSGVTALNAVCCVSGRSNVVAILCKAGACTEIADCCGYSPLSSAAACGDLDTVRLLVKWGACISHSTNMGYNPLHLAAANRHLPVVQYLVSLGLSPYHPSSPLSPSHSREGDKPGHRLSPLLLAALHSQEDIVSYLLEQPECPAEARNEAVEVLYLSKYLSLLTRSLNSGLLIPDGKLTPPPDRAPLIDKFQFVCKEFSSRFQDCALPEYIYHAMRVGCLLSTHGNFSNAETVWLSTMELHLKKVADRGCGALAEVTRGVHYLSCIANQIQLHVGKVSPSSGPLIPHFAKYVEYGIALLEALSQLQDTDMHLLGYAEPVVVSILALLNLWSEVNLSSMENNDATASDLFQLATNMISLASELLNGVTTPLHMVIHWTSPEKYHPYLVICKNVGHIKTMVENICRWGGTHFLNSVDSAGNFPLSLINRSNYRLSFGWDSLIQEVSEIADTLVAYGAHTDALDRTSSSEYIWKDPDVLRLSCLCCHKIVQERLPYDQLTIPPRLKKLIGIHDHKKQVRVVSSATMLSKRYSVLSQTCNYAMQTCYYRLH